MGKDRIIGSIITAGTATVIVDGKPFSVAATDTRYEQLVELLKSGAATPEGVLDILESQKRAAEKACEGTRLSVKDGAVLFDNRMLAGELSDRLMRLIDGGYNLRPLANFVERLMKNPSMRAVKELYTFLEYGKLPLLDDGRFVGYKVVRGDYKDKHSGTFDNSVGKICEMPRNAVDDDSSRTCSFGLHVCSAEYIRSFFSPGDHVMLVAVDPADVVSIPVDYNNTKMRCCKYEVVGEYADYAKDYNVGQQPTFESEVYNDDDGGDRYQEGYDDGYDAGYDAGCEQHAPY